jgi:uncharacterized membrane protein
LTWLITLVGILQLRSAAYARATMPSLQAFTGHLILGWGVFNLVEGIIDHQILGVHNVREVPNYTVYNLTFLAVGGCCSSCWGGCSCGQEAERGRRREGNVHVTPRHHEWR